ncbi:MAG: hypothetical protein ACP5T3_02540 [Candidatus Micrarchaeia archaeon]
MKEVLEFKISTEARTLDEERSLLKRLGDVEAQLREAIASQKLRGKAQLVEQDIAQLTKREEELNAAIAETGKQIDMLRAKLGVATRPKRERQHRQPQSAAAPLTISMQDIAVIKTKKKANAKEQNADEAKQQPQQTQGQV